MIISKPTRYGTGITIWGDYYDLRNLHATVHELCKNGPLEGKFGDVAIGLAYDLRHAYEERRDIKTFGMDECDKVTYRGVKIMWPLYLLQLGLLRWAAAFNRTSRDTQANLFRLEACAEESLTAYDAVVGKQCMEWLERFSGFTTNYYIQYIDECNRKYVIAYPNGKKRFKNLPTILQMFTEISKEYRAFARELEDIAKEKDCSPGMLTNMNDDYPDFKW